MWAKQLFLIIMEFAPPSCDAQGPLCEVAPCESAGPLLGGRVSNTCIARALHAFDASQQRHPLFPVRPMLCCKIVHVRVAICIQCVSSTEGCPYTHAPPCKTRHMHTVYILQGKMWARSPATSSRRLLSTSLRRSSLSYHERFHVRHAICVQCILRACHRKRSLAHLFPLCSPLRLRQRAAVSISRHPPCKISHTHTVPWEGIWKRSFAHRR
jgi:hypothetical protein